MEDIKLKAATYNKECIRLWMHFEVNPTMYRDSISMAGALRVSQEDIVRAYWEIEAQITSNRSTFLKCDMTSLEGYDTLYSTFIYNIGDPLALAICYRFDYVGLADRKYTPYGTKNRGFSMKHYKKVATESEELWELTV